MRWTALIAALMVSTWASATFEVAAANKLSFSSSTFRSAIEASFTEEGTVECPLTLEGSLHTRALSKTGGALFGYVTRATLGACTNGTVTVLQETLPWHIRYGSFSGTLPNIEVVSVQIVDMSVRVRTGIFFTCLARSTGTNPVVMLIVNEAMINGIIFSQTNLIPLSGGTCLPWLQLGGVGNYLVLGTTNRVTLTLI